MSPSSLVRFSLTALAVAASAQAQGSFVDECTDVRLSKDWLIAKCLTGDDATSRIESSIALNSIISNDNARLVWYGNNYRGSCKDCALKAGALSCVCRGAFGGEGATTLNLGEHIANYEGHLLSNSSGPVKIPENSSKLPVPTDFKWNIYPGEQGSCYSTESEIPFENNCSDPPVSKPGECASDSYNWSGEVPVDCTTLRWPVAWDIWTTFQSFRGKSASSAWEFKVYDNPSCTGSPIEVVEPGDETCHKFSKKAVGVKVIPLWNAQW